MGSLGRREVLSVLVGAAVMWPFVARAQQATPVIGYLSLATPGGNGAALAFMQGPAETGYVVGQPVCASEELRKSGHQGQINARDHASI
jgi:hypothetical protein